MDIKRFLRKDMPAPLWKRAVAYAIDVGVLTLILLPLQPELSVASFTGFYQQLSTRPAIAWQMALSVLMIFGLSLVYWALLEYRFHQTLGKYLLKLVVRGDGKVLTFGQCVLRNIAKLSTLLLLLDVLYMFFKQTHQRYSETVAHTGVVSYG